MTTMPLEGSPTWQDVSAAAAGDRDAFARIVAAYHGDMTRVAFVVAGGDQHLADDAVQSAWSIAWRKLRTLRDPARIKGWLITIAANEARQMLRRRVPVMELRRAELLPGGVDPNAGAETMDLEMALRQLRPDERVLLALRYEAGYDSGEIGTFLGTSAASVRGRLARTLTHLRKELTDVRA